MLQTEACGAMTGIPRRATANDLGREEQQKPLDSTLFLSEVARRALVPSGLTPLPHQWTALEFAIRNLEKWKATYEALDAGLGKTIVAALLANYFKDATIFYVCPPFLYANTKLEFDKWCLDGSTRLYLIPDSMIRVKEDDGKIIWQSPAVIQFQHAVLEAHAEDKDPPILIVDEAHRFKNLSSLRTRALMKSMLPYFKKRIVWMSGTPIPNSRPKEIWPVMLYSAPNVFGGQFFPYGLKYCAGYKTEFGWNFDGYSNRKEHKARLTKSFMLRMKKDVLNLPPRIEGLLTVGDGMPPLVSAVEKKILAEYSQEDLVYGEIAKVNGKAGMHLATYLRLLGEYKLKYALPYIKSLLEETNDSIVIFAIHKATIALLEKALEAYAPIVITGAVDKKKRHALVKEFQTNPKRRVLAGNIQACGIGYTMTKAQLALFLEFSWVPGENSQALDRLHRIGQKGTVTGRYIVLKDSIERKRMEVVLRKQQLSL